MESSLKRPSRGLGSRATAYPALKCWAIVKLSLPGLPESRPCRDARNCLYGDARSLRGLPEFPVRDDRQTLGCLVPGRRDV